MKRSLAHLFLLVLLAACVSSQTWSDTQRLFFNYKDNQPLNVTLQSSTFNYAAATRSCYCNSTTVSDPTLFTCALFPGSNNTFAILSVTPKSTGSAGLCRLYLAEAGFMNPIDGGLAAFVDVLAIWPPGRSIAAGVVSWVNVTSTPALSGLDFNALLPGYSRLAATALPTVSFANIGTNRQQFTILDGDKTTIAGTVPYSSTGSLRRNLDMELVHYSTSGTELARFQIARQFILYDNPTLSSVEPKLVRVNDDKSFVISTSNVFVDTTIAKVQFGSSPIRDGTLTSSSQMSVNQILSTLSTNSIQISLDGDNYFTTGGVTVQAYDFPSNFHWFINTTLGDNTCSVFGQFVTIKFNMQPSAISFKNYIPQLTVFDTQFSRTVNCSWSGDLILCPCVEIWDLNINLPQAFKFSLSINGRDFYLSDSMSGTPKITYSKPNSFSVDPPGKFGSDSIISLNMLNMTDRFNTTIFNYEFRLRNKAKSIDRVLTFCTPVPLESRFVCNLPNADLEALCCANPLSDTVASLSCLNAHCPLSVILKMARVNTGNQFASVEFEAANQFVFYSFFKNIISVSPLSVELSSSQWINITGPAGYFLNPGLIKYRLVEKNDSYAVTSGNPAFPRIFNGAVTLVSDSNVRFFSDSSQSVSEGLYNLQLSLNGITYENLTNFDFRAYSPNRMTFTSVIGSEKAVFSTKPVIANITVIGANFFPSTQIMIRYWTPQLTLTTQPCFFFNGSIMFCRTPSVLDLGISLPMNFSISIAMNGVNFVNTPIYVVFEKSDKPVIVQVVPQRGPFQFDTEYSITIKGITKNVQKCFFQMKLSDKDDPLDTNIPYAYSDVKVPGDEEVECSVPTADANFRRGNTTTDWRLFIIDILTNQRSDPFTFQFYNDPVFTKLVPSEGNAFGRETIFITGTGLVDSLATSITFRLHETRADSKCVQINNETISCRTPANQEGVYPLYISYNDYQFRKVGVNNTLLYTVKACSAGNFSRDFETACKPCVSGTYKPLQGFFDCIDCEIARYQPEPGQDRCVKCPAFTTTPATRATSLSQCDCEPGYFRKNGTTSGIACTSCPTGGVCLGVGNLPYPQKDWWWDREVFGNSGEYIYKKCNRENLCSGNLTINDGCAIGHTGPLCERCLPNYFSSNGDCKECDNNVRWRFVVIVLVVLVLVVIIFKFAQLKVTHLSSISIAVSFFQIIAVFSAYNFKWPEELKQALQAFKIFHFDLDIFVPECISDIRYPHKYGLTLALPLMALILIILLFLAEVLRTLVAMQLRRVLGFKLDSWFSINRSNILTKELTGVRRSIAMFLVVPKTVQEIKDFGDKLIHTFVVIVSFSYVFIVTKAAEIFNCIQINDKNVMGAYKDQECYEGHWYIYMTFSILTLVFFGGGVIALFALVVFNRKAIVNSREFNNRFRFLFIRFSNERLYWEIVIIIRKLLISSAIIFFSQFPILVVLFSMLVMFCAFILQTHALPFRRHFHNVMEYIVLLTTEFLLFSGLLFYVNDFPDEWNKNFLGYLCIVVGCLCAAAIILLIILDFIQQMREERHEKLEKRKAKAAAIAKIEQTKQALMQGTYRSPELLSVGAALEAAIDNQPAPKVTLVQLNDEQPPKTPSDKDPTDKAKKPDDDDDEEEEDEAVPIAEAPLSLQLENQTEDDLQIQEFVSQFNMEEDEKDTIMEKFVDWLDIVIAKAYDKKEKVLGLLRDKLVIRGRLLNRPRGEEASTSLATAQELPDINMVDETRMPQPPVQPVAPTILDTSDNIIQTTPDTIQPQQPVQPVPLLEPPANFVPINPTGDNDTPVSPSDDNDPTSIMKKKYSLRTLIEKQKIAQGMIEDNTKKDDSTQPPV